MSSLSTLSTRRLKLSRLRISIAFFFCVSGMSFSSWAVRTPFIQEKLQLTKMDWGFLLLCPVLSSFTATLLSSFLIGHFSSRKTTIVAAYFTILSVVLIGIAPSVWTLGGAFIVFGAGIGLIDISMNDQAAALERLYQRSIMSSFHGIFSLGAMLGSLLGGLLAKFAVTPAYHLSVVAILLMVGVLINQKYLLHATDNITDEIKAETKIPLIVLPKGKLWILGCVASAAVFVEGAMADWSALFLENMGAKEWLAALGLAFFTGTMAFGRLLGDRWVDYVGAIRAIQWGAACSVLGLFIALVSHFPVVAIIGFALSGIGMAIIFPCLLTLAAGAKTKEMSSAASIASVAMMGYVMMLLGPPMIGFLAHVIGLHLAFIALFLSSIVVLCLAGFASPNKN